MPRARAVSRTDIADGVALPRDAIGVTAERTFPVRLPPPRIASALLSLAAVLVACPLAADGKDEDPGYEPEIRAFEEADRKQMPPAGGVLFVGSSSIRLWRTLADDFPGLKVINRGFGGSQIPDSTRYAPRIVIPYRPKTIVLYAGDNDIAAGRAPEQVLADFEAFVKTVRAELPDVRILFIAIKPSVARWALVDKIRDANRLVKDFAEADPKRSLGYIDIFTPMLGDDGKPRKELLVEDGLHLSPAGYELWTSIVCPHVGRD